MNVITSLHIYNFHLFISYLNKGIRIIPFEIIDKYFYKKEYIYPKYIEINKNLIEFTTFNNLAVGISNYKIETIPLIKDIQYKKRFDELNIYENEEISLDYEYLGKKNLYILTRKNGIFEYNISNVMNPIKTKNIIPKTFEKIGNPVISNMVAKNKQILISIRGYGASKVFDFYANKPIEKIYRTEDAQDAISYNEELTIVADGLEGIIVFDKNKRIRKIKLPNNDFPQELKNFYNKLLIKGKNGLYLYNIYDNVLHEIWQGSIGAFTSYYNYIVFSSNGRINLLVNTEKYFNKFQIKETEDIDIKFNKYLR